MPARTDVVDDDSGPASRPPAPAARARLRWRGRDTARRGADGRPAAICVRRHSLFLLAVARFLLLLRSTLVRWLSPRRLEPIVGLAHALRNQLRRLADGDARCRRCRSASPQARQSGRQLLSSPPHAAPRRCRLAHRVDQIGGDCSLPSSPRPTTMTALGGAVATGCSDRSAC